MLPQRPPSTLTSLGRDEFAAVMRYVTDANDIYALVATGDGLCARLVSHCCHCVHLRNHHDVVSASKHSIACQIFSSAAAGRRSYRAKPLAAHEFLCEGSVVMCVLSDRSLAALQASAAPSSKPYALLAYVRHLRELVIEKNVFHLQDIFPSESADAVARLTSLVIGGSGHRPTAVAFFNYTVRTVSRHAQHVFPSLQSLCITDVPERGTCTRNYQWALDAQMFPVLTTLVCLVEGVAIVSALPRTLTTLRVCPTYFGNFILSQNGPAQPAGLTALSVDYAGTLDVDEIVEDLPSLLTCLPRGLKYLSVSVRATLAGRLLPTDAATVDLFLARLPPHLDVFATNVFEDPWSSVDLSALCNKPPRLMFIDASRPYRRLLDACPDEDLPFYHKNAPSVTRVMQTDFLDLEPRGQFNAANVTLIPETFTARAGTIGESARLQLAMATPQGAFGQCTNFSALRVLKLESHLNPLSKLTGQTKAATSVFELEIEGPNKSALATGMIFNRDAVSCLLPSLEVCDLTNLFINLNGLTSIASNALRHLSCETCVFVIPDANRALSLDMADPSLSSQVSCQYVKTKCSDTAHRSSHQRGVFCKVFLNSCTVAAKAKSVLRRASVNPKVAPCTFANLASHINATVRTNCGDIVYHSLQIACSAPLCYGVKISPSFKSFLTMYN